MRRIDSSALTAVIPVVAILPAWFVATSLCFLATDVVFDPGYAGFMSVAALGSVVMFLPLTQRLFVTRLLGVRSPSPDEAKRLESAVRIVATSADNGNRRFILAIDESPEVNAFACGGHILVVSSFAVRNLHDEYAHHHGAHTIGLSFAQWFALPVVVFARTGFRLRTFAERQRMKAEFRPGGYSAVSGHFLRAASAVLNTFAVLFEASLRASQNLNNVVGRNAEFQADRRVVAMGFGRHLAQALGHARSNDQSMIDRTWHERIFSSHPPARTRIARIEAMLRSGRR
jgi:Zn-dependent protease with chaperone function